MKRKHEVNHRRLQIRGTRLLYFTLSRDGMIVSQLTQVSPLTLSDWSKTPQWKKDLSFWGYDGTPSFHGEEFEREVSKSLMRRSLKKAGQLWRQLFGLTENQNELSPVPKRAASPFFGGKKSPVSREKQRAQQHESKRSFLKGSHFERIKPLEEVRNQSPS